MNKTILSFWLVISLAFISSSLGAFNPLCVNFVPVPPDPEPPPPAPTNVVIAQSFILPIEVLGGDGTIKSFELVHADADDATDLWIEAHALTYENKASIRVNGGDWLTLNDTNVVWPYVRERAFHGMGGILSTVRFTVPLADWTLVSGTNTVEFRFNDLNGLTVGYRVLDMKLLNGETTILDSDDFTYDDPSAWVPPSTNSVDIAAGREAWFNLTIKEGGVTLNAKCQDCHFHDGGDLKILNYSANSIIMRSIFHDVPAATATNIASYILSLPYTYQTNGRPWNPPFQPAPGMDSVSQHAWFAGAGIDAVLDDELDILDYLFPDGITTNALNFTTQTINAREIPLFLQLPDWNRWLPQVHPFDSYPDYYFNSTNRFIKIYTDLTNNLIGVTGLAAATLVEKQKSNWDKPSDRGGVAAPADNLSAEYTLWHKRRKAARHWRVVKTAEMMVERELQEFGTELFGSLSADRRWFHGEIFQLGPHKLATANGTGAIEDETFESESMQWYQLQLVLNDGNRKGGTIVPIDWGYQHALNNSAWTNPEGLPLYGATILNMLKGTEVLANGLPLSNVHGWRPGNGRPDNLAPGTTRAYYYAQIDAGIRADVAEAVIIAWLRECRKFTKAEYDAEGITNDFNFNLIYNLAVNIEAIGADHNVINELVDWGEYLFPLEDWSGARP